MVHQSDRDPRPGDEALVIDLGPHPRRFIRPAAWMFATALAPCLCASEARPSDQGFQASGIRPSAITSTPSSGGRPLQRAGNSGLRQPSTPAPAPPRLTSHRQVYPRAGQRGV